MTTRSEITTLHHSGESIPDIATTLGMSNADADPHAAAKARYLANSRAILKAMPIRLSPITTRARSAR